MKFDPKLASDLLDQLFSDKDAALSGNRRLELKRTRRGLRYYEFDDGDLIEQNPNTQSKFAERARKGEKIAWFIPKDGGRWKLVLAKKKSA